MNRSASASAYGAQTREENGVPWQNTTGGPEPAGAQAIRRPSHSKISVSSMRPMLRRRPGSVAKPAASAGRNARRSSHPTGRSLDQRPGSPAKPARGRVISCLFRAWPCSTSPWTATLLPARAGGRAGASPPASLASQAVLRRVGLNLLVACVIPGIVFYSLFAAFGVWPAIVAALAWSYGAIGSAR